MAQCHLTSHWYNHWRHHYRSPWPTITTTDTHYWQLSNHVYHQLVSLDFSSSPRTLLVCGFLFFLKSNNKIGLDIHSILYSILSPRVYAKCQREFQTASPFARLIYTARLIAANLMGTAVSAYGRRLLLGCPHADGGARILCSFLSELQHVQCCYASMGDEYACGCLRRGEEYEKEKGAHKMAPTGGKPTSSHSDVFPWLSDAASGGHAKAITNDIQDLSDKIYRRVDGYLHQRALWSLSLEWLSLIAISWFCFTLANLISIAHYNSASNFFFLKIILGGGSQETIYFLGFNNQDYIVFSLNIAFARHSSHSIFKSPVKLPASSWLCPNSKDCC